MDDSHSIQKFRQRNLGWELVIQFFNTMNMCKTFSAPIRFEVQKKQNILYPKRALYTL